MDEFNADGDTGEYAYVFNTYSTILPGMKKFILMNCLTGEVVDDETEQKCPAKKHLRSEKVTLAEGSRVNRNTKVL